MYRKVDIMDTPVSFSANDRMLKIFLNTTDLKGLVQAHVQCVLGECKDKQ